MSSALLRKSLALCDPDLKQFNANKERTYRKKKDTKARITYLNKHQKIESERKVTVREARNKLKQNDKILKDNLQRIKSIRKKYKVKLDENITEQIIERALTRKPVASKPKEKKVESTAFTEEDFKKFEAEYNDC